MFEHLRAEHEICARIRQAGGLGGAGEVGAVIRGEIERLHVVPTSLENRPVRTPEAAHVERERARARCSYGGEELLDVRAQRVQHEIVVLPR